jgi:bifunctional DNase/RNase
MLVEMELREIVRGAGMHLIALGERLHERRQFTIAIGMNETLALEMAVHGEVATRPLTHDLIVNVIQGMGGALRRVIIDRLVEEWDEKAQRLHGVYHGKLDIQLRDHTSVWIDSRPSDAIVLASRLRVPIFVDEEVLRAVCEAHEEDDSV